MRRGIITAVIVVVGIILLIALVSPHVYLFKLVNQQEVGVMMRSGKVIQVVPAGVYSDAGLFAQMVKVNTQAVVIDVTDPELITSDKQLIGLQVTADAFRPDYAKNDMIMEKWSQYRQLFIDDTILIQKVSSFALQAMKVCVGDRTFDQNVIGSGRDELRQCIDEELSSLAERVGVDVQNVVVPQVIISQEVRTSMDQIVQSRLATEKAKQDALKAKEEAAAKQAAQEGEIRVQQSVQQETMRQQIITADLEKQKLQAQLSVIDAQRTNAEQELLLQQALAAIAAEKANIELAKELALAKLYTTHPEYLSLQMTMANASAIKNTDKLIFTPIGMMPNLVLSNGLTIPTLPGSNVYGPETP
ncbi:MAG: hypothetical protein CVU39_01750 [Chloroflexi bacterium HGW-Chloroflexi-10]|nr:MAG: hypothetical protein CVU39_01750 [Chloroflexi bacterium HGW-Chloroflexi-10]